MEQFRLAGEALGSIKALMMFQDETSVNQRQCGLLVDAFELAFRSVAQEMRSRLRFDEKLTKWKALEHPLRELHRIFREGEQYVRQCLEPRDWWGKAMALNQNTDCIDVHLHDLLWCLFVVIEAIENVGEITGTDHEDLNKKKLVLSKKYEREWMDPKLFQLKFGKLYLASQDLCSRMDAAWKEDRWMLSETIAEKRRPGSKPLSKHENRLADVLVSPKGKLFPCSVLTGSSDYQLRRKFGPANTYKEVQWLGESFAVKHVIREIEPLMSEIALLSSISHPNVVHYMYSFADEEKKECFVVMELMSKDLSTYMKEVSSARRKTPFTLSVAIDTMLQIARGMEYLHSKSIYHGELNPSNILVRPRSASPDGNLHVKVSGFGLAPIKNFKPSSTQASVVNPCTWYAPEVLLEMERSGSGDGISISKCTDKADVYSFAMISFELLTGKVPFEDNHLQGDKMSKNIRIGERPLFPFPLPKYLTDLPSRCWHTDPSQRPSFSSICRILRYTKRFLIMNPDHSQPNAPVPPVDYYDIEMSLSRRFANSGGKECRHVSEIPFQMYAYRVVEREKLTAHFRDRNSDSGSEGTASLCSDESAGSAPLDSVKSAPFTSETNRTPTRKAANNGMFNKLQGQQQRAKSLMMPSQLASPLASPRRSLRTNSEKLQTTPMSSRRRRMAGHAYVSDSELT